MTARVEARAKLRTAKREMNMPASRRVKAYRTRLVGAWRAEAKEDDDLGAMSTRTANAAASGRKITCRQMVSHAKIRADGRTHVEVRNDSRNPQ